MFFSARVFRCGIVLVGCQPIFSCCGFLAVLSPVLPTCPAHSINLCMCRLLLTTVSQEWIPRGKNEALCHLSTGRAFYALNLHLAFDGHRREREGDYRAS